MPHIQMPHIVRDLLMRMRLLVLLAGAVSLLASGMVRADGCCRLEFERFTELALEGEVSDLAISPDGRFLYEALATRYDESTDAFVGGGIRVLRVDARSGRPRRVELFTEAAATPDAPFPSMLTASRLLLSPDGDHLYAAAGSRIAVLARDARSGRLSFLGITPPGPGVRGMAMSADGLSLYASGFVGLERGIHVYRRNRATGALDLLETHTGAGVLDLQLQGPVLVSTDGTSVYVTAGQSSSDGILVLDRDPRTGRLSGPRAVLETDGPELDQLHLPAALELDASGRNFYVASRGGLTHFARDPVTGDLEFLQRLMRGADGWPPLGPAQDMVLAADGRSLVYLQNRTFHVVNVDAADGSMRFVESQAENQADQGVITGDPAVQALDAFLARSPRGERYFFSSNRGVGSFLDRGQAPAPRILGPGPVLTEGGDVSGLGDATAMDVSPDGRFLYVAGAGSGASDPSVLSVFQVDPVTGDYAPLTSYSDGNTPSDDIGLQIIRSIAVSADGQHLYAVALQGFVDQHGSLAVFQRDLDDGTLSIVQTMDHLGEDGFGNPVLGLLAPRAVRLSPDGQNVYVVGMIENSTPGGTVGVFRRDVTSGALEFLQVVENQLDVGGPVLITEPHDIAFSPDGRLAYLGAGGRYAIDEAATDALTVFRRLDDGTLEHLATVDDTGDFSQIDALAVSPDGRHLYAKSRGITGSAGPLGIFELDRSTGMPVFSYPHGNGVAGMRGTGGAGPVIVSADGRLVAVTGGTFHTGMGWAGGVTLFERDRQTGALRVLEGRTGEEMGLDTLSLAVLDPTDFRLHVVDPRGGTLATLRPHPGAVLTEPSDEDRLPGADVQFRWDFFGTARPGRVRLQVGTAEGLGDIFDKRFGATARSARVGGLPLDGSTLHLTLTTGDLPSYATTFTAASLPEPALVEPADGDRLPTGRVTFRWSDNGHPVKRWELLLGTTAGGDDLYSRRFGARSRQARVKNLPQDGSEVFATLRATVGDDALETTASYTAALPPSELARRNGSTFTWTRHPGDAGYRLIVGSMPGAEDLCDSGELASFVSDFDCPALPEDGRELFVTLERTATSGTGEFTSRDTLVLEPALPEPTILEPESESTLGGHTVLFTLDRASRAVSAWELRIGTRKGRSDLFRARLPGEATEVEVTGLPTLGGDVHARLFYTIDGRRRFTDFRFEAADFPLPQLIAPAAGKRLDGTPLTFSWRDRRHDLSAWRLDLGTAPGASDFGSIRSDGPNDADTATDFQGEGFTDLSVEGIPADTRVHARWSYRIAGERDERFQDVELLPTTAACCEASVLASLEGGGGNDGLSGVIHLAASPDGAHVYTVTAGGGALVTLARETDGASPDFGTLTYVEKLDLPESSGARVLVDPVDGSHVYVTMSNTVATYVRETDAPSADFGRLTQVQTLSTGTGSTGGGAAIAMAPGGTHLYVLGSFGLNAFAVDPVDGTLTHIDGDSGLVASISGGYDLVALGGPGNDVHLYVTTGFQNSLVVLSHDRDTETVAQAQILADGDPGLDGDNPGLAIAQSMVASAAGDFLYVQLRSSSATELTVLQRDPSTGLLTPRPDQAGAGNLFAIATSLVLSGARLYALAGSIEIAVYAVDPATGEVGDVDTVDGKIEREFDGVGAARAMLASPDGEHLYVAISSAPGPGINTYDIGVAGPPPEELALLDTLEDGEGGIAGLDQLNDLVPSPDGRFLYGVSLQNTITVLDYDAATGALTQAQVMDRTEPGLESLNFPRSVVLSPDGLFAYVPRANGVVILERDPDTGLLSVAEDATFDPFLGNALSLAMSPDGRHLYLCDETRDVLAVLARDEVTGEVTEVARYEQGVDFPPELNDPRALFVSPDGRNVYVISTSYGTVASFRRAPRSGALDFLGIAVNGEDGIAHMEQPLDLAQSRDGKDVYVLSRENPPSLEHFRRRRGNGLLLHQGPIVSDVSEGLLSLRALEMHPEADLLYVAGTSGIAAWTRSPGDGSLMRGVVISHESATLLAVSPAGMPLFVYTDPQVRVLDYHPFLVSPAPGSTLSAQTTTFTWNANGLAPSGWRLLAGSSPGGRDYCDSGSLPRAAREHDCSGLPRSGEAVFVTLLAQAGDGGQAVQAQYTAATLGLPGLAGPVPGATVSGSQVFTLDGRGNDVEQWRIVAGTTPGGRDLFRGNLPGDETQFVIDGLAPDRDVFVSVESRGAFGRETTVYQYNPPAGVTPVYPRAGARWGDYVRAGDDMLGGSDRSCRLKKTAGREACLHGGEHRMFVVPGVLSCDGVQAQDSFGAAGAFEWVCSQDMMPVRMVSVGLKAGMQLSDLLDLTAPAFQAGRLTVSDGGPTTLSDQTIWWDNPVEAADEGGLLTGSGTVYVTGTPQPLAPFEIVSRRGVSLVVSPGIALVQAVTPGDALVRLDRADFAWVEGELDAPGASFGVQVDASAWPVLSGVQVRDVNSVAAKEFARVGRAGIAMDRTRNALLRGVHTDDTGDAGVALYRTTGSRLEDVHAGRAVTGVLLNRSSGNRLEALVVAANEAEGLALDDRSRDNVLAQVTSTSNEGDGVVIAGQSHGNRLFQVLSRHNGGSGVLVDDSRGTLLGGLTALDNDMDGLTLSAAKRSALLGLALGNNAGDGLLLSGSQDTLVLDVAAAHQGGAGVRLEQGSTGNLFRGELRVGNNSVGDCAVEDGLSGLDTGCAVSGASDAVVTTGITLAGAFAGAVSVDDPRNESDGNGQALAGDIDDWVSFASQWRGWGPDGAFPDAGARGRCTDDVGGATCVIQDARLRAGDTGAGGLPALAGPALLPGVDDELGHRLLRRERFLAFARELLGDGVGDDDGLCEANEHCLVMPHLGAYQGDGGLEEVLTLGSGVTLFRHQTLLLPPP